MKKKLKCKRCHEIFEGVRANYCRKCHKKMHLERLHADTSSPYPEVGIARANARRKKDVVK